MRDRRVQAFRSTALSLIESLYAVVRVSRWTGEDAVPEPLTAAAGKVVERLGAADRLVGSRYEGPEADVALVASMCEGMKRLDMAYRAYRQSPSADAAATLESEVAAVDAGAWQ